MSVSIELEHHRFEIDFSKLLQIDYQGYYTANEAWDELLDLGAAKDNLINQANITLDRNDLIIANYCYPESVFADPVNDFKEYRKWELGVRQFPFSGQYHHLDIRKQDKKKPSEALKGALGEMIGGTLFNNIAHILVRPILRYPDFIGKQPKANAWAYLEAKCFEKPTGTLLFNNRVQQATDSGYKALCLKAASEIRVNKWLTCYASFSEIIHYDPLNLQRNSPYLH